MGINTEDFLLFPVSGLVVPDDFLIAATIIFQRRLRGKGGDKGIVAFDVVASIIPSAVEAVAVGGDVLGEYPEPVSFAACPLRGGEAVVKEALHAAKERLAGEGLLIIPPPFGFAYLRVRHAGVELCVELAPVFLASFVWLLGADLSGAANLFQSNALFIE